MKFSVAVEYALHGLIYMAGLEENKSIRIQDMSRFQGISESYLSKTYAKLAKAGIISSAAGAKGGYRLSRPAEQISFCSATPRRESTRSRAVCSIPPIKGI